MTKKLGISPDISYMLGIYNCNSSYSSVRIATASNEMIERFVRISVSNLGIKPETIQISKESSATIASIKNSKLKKLLDNALEKRDRIFRYRNEYSGSYFAAMFDCNGAADSNGIFIKGMKSYDAILLERIGFHTKTKYGRCYIGKPLDFMMFIAPFSIKARIIHWPGNERDLR